MLSVLNRLRSIVALSSAALFLSPSVQAQHDWPIELGNSDHPMGNTFGQYLAGYQHAGIDIMETPMYDGSDNLDPAAPWVIVTVGGDVTRFEDVSGGTHNFTAVDPTDPTDTAVYDYGHLQSGSYHVDYKKAFNDGTQVNAGDRIAKLVRWPKCDFHHLHHEIQDGANFISPLADITPNPDSDPPEIDGIYFAEDNSNPWVPFNSLGPGGCTVVSGSADIVVKARDRDEAGAALGGIGVLWVYDIRWRACPDTSTSCTWQNTRPFDTMPTAWNAPGNASTAAQFSTRTPWISGSDYCDPDWYYAIVTNYVGGTPNVAGAWDTTTGYPDGSYSVSVEATDFAGNVTVFNTRACVQNTAACTTELVIQDATDDNGAIPYPGPNWWRSPDITANPGTPDEDKNINIGSANPIEVQVWNYGSCNVPAGTTYDVCLGWGLPSGSVAHPLPPDQVIGCAPETVPTGGWSAGTNRVTTFTWTPDAADVPLGHHCLIAWVNMTDDPVLNTASVKWDDNRAQQNITFQLAPPGDPASSSFWINPQEMIKERSLELTFNYSGREPTVQDVKLHVAPGLIVERIVGGSIVGGYEGEKPLDVCRLTPEELHRVMCMSWEETSKLGYTRVLGGIDPSGRLRLEGIQPVRRPVRLTLEVWTKDGIRDGEFAAVDVVEYGVLSGHKEVAPVGGLTMRFEH